jgi:hypothetical protein
MSLLIRTLILSDQSPTLLVSRTLVTSLEAQCDSPNRVTLDFNI